MIGRDISAAESRSHDLIVVGGGVYGITLALESARRGLRPLLLEQGDFGGCTSWHSLRIVHGGLRYLQKMDLPRFVESVAERSWFLQHFPELVSTIPCLMPLYGRGLRRASVMRLALFVNDSLSRGRNRNLRADRHIGAGRIVSAAETEQLFPGVVRDELQAGALWHDGVMPDSQRLLVEMLRWAAHCGAAALNYVEAEKLLLEDGRAVGVQAVDRESGATHCFRAPLVVNCAGPWCGEVARRFDGEDPELFRPSMAFNVFLEREPLSQAAVAVTPPSPGARTYFMYPWKGGVFAGTFHAAWKGGPDEPPSEALVQRLLVELNAAVPSLDVGLGDVIRLHWGQLPAAAPDTDRLAVREMIRDHGKRGGPHGLFSVSGVKFTTARRVAVKLLETVMAARGESLSPSRDAARPAVTPVPDATEIRRLLDERPADARRIVESLIRDEAALHLEDLLLRRTDWGLRPAVGHSIARSLCELLEWSDARCSSELAGLADGAAVAPAAH